MFGQALKQWFWDCYDTLGRLLVANLLLCLVLWPTAIVMLEVVLVYSVTVGSAEGILLFAAVGGLLAPLFGTVWASGLLWFGHLSSEGKDPGLRAFFHGFRAAGLRTWLFLQSAAAIQILLTGNIWFYLYRSESLGGVVGQALGVLCIWMTVFLAGIVLHGLPMVARRRMRLATVYRNGVALWLKYPFVTLGMLLLFASLFLLSVALRFAPLLLGAFSFLMMFLNSVHDVLVMEEQRQEVARNEASGEAQEQQPTSWHAIRDAEEQAEQERMNHDRYSRTWSDILRPWEM